MDRRRRRFEQTCACRDPRQGSFRRGCVLRGRDRRGGRGNGAAGIRAHYHPDYYGAFVLDPDGHNIEAVCHASE
jgi:hypothetical protein